MVGVGTVTGLIVITLAIWVLTRPQAMLMVPGGRFEVFTQSQAVVQGCRSALLEGTLVPDQTYGFVIRGPLGAAQVVMWPFGYHGVNEQPLGLYDASNVLVAHAGDRLAMGGGIDAQNRWLACPFDMVRTPAASASAS